MRMRTLLFLSYVFCAHFAHAHGRWIIPSSTIVSGDEDSPVSFDISLSNDVFHPDRAYGGIPLSIIEFHKQVAYSAKPTSSYEADLRAWNASVKLRMTPPSGLKDKDLPLINLLNKSSSATQLAENGTYLFETSHPPVQYISFKKPNGEYSKQFGAFNLKTLPQGATDIRKIRLVPQIRTYVTKNTLSEQVLQIKQKGLELQFSAHPNELFVGESLTVNALFNGKNLTDNTRIKLTRAGTRYRNNRDQKLFTLSDSGSFEITWERSDMYLLEVETIEISDDIEIHHTIYLTLEVNPE